jgi:predicted HicB family RNase H-like nuclease
LLDREKEVNRMAKKQTSLYLEPELKKKIKLLVVEQDTSFNEWVTEAIKEKLKRESLQNE